MSASAFAELFWLRRHADCEDVMLAMSGRCQEPNVPELISDTPGPHHWSRASKDAS
jgi:hypothetical protein